MKIYLQGECYHGSLRVGVQKRGTRQNRLKMEPGNMNDGSGTNTEKGRSYHFEVRVSYCDGKRGST